METPFLLPSWLRLFWIVVYAVIVSLHLHHAARKGGQARTWHSIHIAMAMGMIYMFFPTHLKVVPGLVWGAVFLTLACVSVTSVSRVWLSYRVINLLWLLSLIDALAMVYMFALPRASISSLTDLFILYFTGIMVAWVFGAFDASDPHDRPLKFIVTAQFRHTPAPIKSLNGPSSVGLRASLAAMAAGMAYMFLIMQFGS